MTDLYRHPLFWGILGASVVSAGLAGYFLRGGSDDDFSDKLSGLELNMLQERNIDFGQFGILTCIDDLGSKYVKGKPSEGWCPSLTQFNSDGDAKKWNKKNPYKLESVEYKHVTSKFNVVNGKMKHFK